MTPTPPIPTPAPWRVTLLRMVLRLAVIGTVVLIVYATLDWVMQITAPQDGSMPWAQLGVLGLLLAGYALLLAIPFVPGVEIGVTLLAMQGATAAPAVYLATLIGLGTAFLIGRSMPPHVLRNLLLDLRLIKLCAFLDHLQPLSDARRLALFRKALPSWLGDWPVRFRYVALALLINLPGSALIGGGGGILLLAGLSGLFLPKATFLTIALAVAPVPLLVWLIGPGILS